MSERQKLVVKDSIWIRSDKTDQQYIFRSIRTALLERGIKMLTFDGPGDVEGLEKIRKTVRQSDAHVIMDGLIPADLRKLRPFFEDRKNFSMALVDWWTNPYWFTQNADYLIFRNYNGIVARRGIARFMTGRRPPLFAMPDKRVKYNLICSALRLPALLAAPFLDCWKNLQRKKESFGPERLLYFPFTVAEEHVPLLNRPVKYDFANLSATGGYWTMRDPHASAWLNYGNLYYDRLRLTELIKEVGPYNVFDLRKSHYLNWEEYCEVTRASRFAIATGGLHQNSVAKYTEFACLGTPMLGEEIPYELPWLKDCLFPVEISTMTRDKLAPMLREALALQPRLREQCLAHRDTLLKLYNAHRVLDLLQEQADGKPVPPGYLKPEALGGAVNQG